MKPINNNMYAIKPKINFKKAFLNFVFTKNINSIAKNIQPMEPNDIHILSIDDTNNTGNTNFPTFLQQKKYCTLNIYSFAKPTASPDKDDRRNSCRKLSEYQNFTIN